MSEIEKSAIVLAPHPDDEVLGCGGLIAATLAAGAEVQLVIVSDGAQGGDAVARNQDVGALRQALGGIDRFSFQMSVASLRHQQLLHAIKLLGTQVAPKIRQALP